MRPVVVSLVGNGASTQNSSPIVVDYRSDPFNIGLAVTTSGSTTTMTVQYSYDDPNGTYVTSYNANATWFSITALTTKTTATDGVLTNPCRAVRLQAGATGTDTVTLTLVQATTGL